jgi:hypothetical protein
MNGIVMFSIIIVSFTGLFFILRSIYNEPNPEELYDRRLNCFEKNVIKNDIGCWQWDGRKNIGGYGSLSDNWPAHRFSYEHHIGPIPEGLFCLHKCDVRDCCRPDHLFLGTIKENNLDMYAKKRQYQSNNGRHPRAKLTNEQVIEVRKLVYKGRSQSKIAKQFNISQSTISDITHNKTYKDI